MSNVILGIKNSLFISKSVVSITVNDIGISTTDKIPENDMLSDTILNEGDELVCYGPEKGLLKLGGLFRVQERNAAHK
ncbi:MAG: hypothetical protein MJY65_02060 [Bacteroidaceae bacterium]|nr:hypothetical protein [Bacteroidaceae bacterium]